MKKIIITFIAVLLLTGCSNEEEKAFEKKQECISYKNNIDQTLKENSSLDIAHNLLEEIFYSPKLNSCLYTYKRIFTNYKELGYDLNIVDYLSNSQVWYMNSNFDSDIDSLFRKELLYYKEK